MIFERLFRLRGWVGTLVGIVVLVGFYYAFQGINYLVAPANNPCGSINPTCAVRPATKLPSVTNPTLTPTTQNANCGELPVGPGAGPPPAACSGLP